MARASAIAAVGFALLSASTTVAHAQEIQLDGPLLSPAESERIASLPTQTPAEQQRALRGSRVALARRGCITPSSTEPEVVAQVTSVLANARALYTVTKDQNAALDALDSARRIASLPAVEELEAEIHLDTGRIAHARAALEAHEACSGLAKSIPTAIVFELESIRARTATLSIGSNGRRIIVDGITLLTSHAMLYLEAGGSHSISIEDQLGVAHERTVAFGGGEVEHIEIEGVGFGDDSLTGQLRTHSRTHASPWRDRRRYEPLGLTVALQSAVDTAGSQPATSETNTNPMTWGVRFAMFVRSASNDSELRGGVFGVPSASSKGLVMPTGVFASAHLFTPSVLAIGVGVASGYLITPNPSRTVVDNFEARRSFFFEPHIPVSFAVGDLEIETRLGLMWSSQEDAIRSRFAPSYLTMAAGLTWVPRKSSL